MTIDQIHALFLESTGVCTDTRVLQEKQLFFALKGDNFNGNRYAQNALEAGASYAIIDEEAFDKGAQYILVDDVLTSLQELASYHRDYVGTSIIAITGSNGKTTTKELLHAALAPKYKVFATKGNFNNHIGVPLSLLSITKAHELAIIEMGANHQKEIESYCVWTRPNFGLITNCGKAHLEGFGGIQGVIKGKTELYEAIEKNDGKVFYNSDDKVLSEQSAHKVRQRLSYGTNEMADYPYRLDTTEDFVKVLFDGVEIQSNLVGQYNGSNLAAALAIGKYFDVPVADMKKSIEAYHPDNNRSQISQHGSNQVVLDAYNANPTSMIAALENFERFKAAKKGVFLGDMFEVGETSAEEHAHIVSLLESLNFDFCVLVGKHFYEHKNANFHFFEETEEAKSWFNTQDFHGYTFLIKGSRGMKMEGLLE